MAHFRSRVMASLGVVLVAALLLSLVGPRPLAAEERPKVVLLQGVRSMAFSSVFVALGKKFFEAEGVDVELQIVRGDPLVFQGVFGGLAPFGAVGSTELVTAAGKGLKGIIAVASVASAVTVSLVLRKEVAEERKLSPALPINQRIAGLKGLKLAASSPGGAIHTVLMYLLRQAGLDPTRDMTIISLGTPAEMLAALSATQIDGFAISPPAPEMAAASGAGVVLVQLSQGEIPELGNMVYDALVTRLDYAQKNPETVRKVVRALGRACNLIRERPDEAYEVLQTFFDKTPPDIMRVAVKNIRTAYAKDARFTEEVWKNTIGFNLKAGKIRAALDTREGVLWTNSFNTGE